MARVSDGILPGTASLALTLDRYQEIMVLPINAFNGLNNPDETPVYECSTIWKQSERNHLAMWIAAAESMRELELGYHLAPKYITNEEHPYGNPVCLNRKHLVAVGVRTISAISAGVVLDHGVETNPNDPVTITVATSVVADEIAVFYPGETVEITPSSVSVTGGIATIRIPRARLVKPTLLDDRDDHLSYYENDNFLATVDVSRMYTNPSIGAYLVWGGEELVEVGAQTYPDDDEVTQLCAPQILGASHYRLSLVHLYPATYTSGSFTGVSFTYCTYPKAVRVSYQSGRQSSMLTEMDTAKLAHVLMPNRPTNCPYVLQYWQEDTKDHPSGLVTPYGHQVGAVRAWLSDSRAKVGQGGIFPSVS